MCSLLLVRLTGWDGMDDALFTRRDEGGRVKCTFHTPAARGWVG